MKKSSTIWLLVTAMICLGGCSSNSSKSQDSSRKGSSPNEVQTVPKYPEPPIEPKPDQKDEVLRDIKIPASLAGILKVTEDPHISGTAELISQIIEKKPISFSLITDLFISKHLRMYDKIRSNLKISEVTPKFDDFRKTLKDLESKVTEKNDLHVLKNQMEDSVGIKTYNKDYFTIPNVISQKKLQCYSGTSTFEVFSRDVLGAKAYQAQNQVVIMSKGHILAGYMEKDKESDWNLVGIETTVKGKAKVSYGKVKNIYKGNALRIYDANLWMILEVLVPYLKDTNKNIDESKVVAEALEITNAMYDNQIPVTELEKKVIEESKDRPTDPSNKGEEAGFGGFGIVSVPAGDISRTEADEINPFYTTPPVISSSKTVVPTKSNQLNNDNATENSIGNQSPQLPKTNVSLGDKTQKLIVVQKFLNNVLELRKIDFKIPESETNSLCLEDIENMPGHWKNIDLFQEKWSAVGENISSLFSNLKEERPKKPTECELQDKILVCKDVARSNTKTESAKLEYIGEYHDNCWFKVRFAADEAYRSVNIRIFAMPIDQVRDESLWGNFYDETPSLSRQSPWAPLSDVTIAQFER